MNRYCISSKDMIVLRDGRPFGEIGTFGGGVLDWPMPQTIAGMCRTAVGNCRSDDFFRVDNKEEIKKLKNITLKRILPGLLNGEGHQPLLPVPADLQFFLAKDQHVFPMNYERLVNGDYTDIGVDGWLYPFPVDKVQHDKPDAPPMFLSSGLAEHYINGSIPVGGISLDVIDTACYNILSEMRMHSSIDPTSRSVIDGHLFSEKGIYLEAIRVHSRRYEETIKKRDYGTCTEGDLSIDFDLTGSCSNDKLEKSAYLGGERRRVEIEVFNDRGYIGKIKNSKNQQYLKIVLTTHGDFGNWVPEWLLQGGNIENIRWTLEPRSGVELKLRSAVINGWDPCSGWDYEQRKPKPFRKLVKPGSVYLVELKYPEKSDSLIDALHGESICSQGSAGEKDGYGQVVIAVCHEETIERVYNG